ncbi:hypothetical protein EDD70_2120 [Hydrogenoanaerobacterium saccharovorans]|uniref:Uncharacterized protein n=1 Tax=Hydrogenoanaerobacterium saccharovorans TaxID=474960 RepID=A0A1H8CJP3_9FIRM|nr:hypothetical protein [Hydrogenoanaerobacterium saccharovorans]RPF43160.1 hypothetical protein EDD70_2120 [Hydrogenoanaerobacterium saccharovorans]SEM95255.1 hypothetical protein SAMN05216180_2178 [Hydrogenoanaerobacterium saccharovorans]
MKNKIRIFGLSFFSTMVLMVLLCGFAVADNNTRQTGYGDFVPLLQAAQTDALHYNVSVMGEQYEVNVGCLNTAAGYLQKMSPYMPVKGRLAVKLAALGVRAVEENLIL